MYLDKSEVTVGHLLKADRTEVDVISSEYTSCPRYPHCFARHFHPPPHLGYRYLDPSDYLQIHGISGRIVLQSQLECEMDHSCKSCLLKKHTVVMYSNINSYILPRIEINAEIAIAIIENDVITKIVFDKVSM